MARRNPEYHSCVAIITWWAFACRMFKVPEFLLMHIPNQAAGSPIRGMHLKRMGVRSGVPDYFLAVARGGFHGLYIEVKAAGGRLSDEQKKLQISLAEQGYLVKTCNSTDETRAAIEGYLTPYKQN